MNKSPLVEFKQSVLVRKLKKWVFYYAKQLLPENESAGPAVFVNSVPKSGTHLLYQIFEGNLGLTDYGEFIPSTPSFTMREASDHQLVRRLGKVKRGELFRGHLFYKTQLAIALKRRKILHFFIYRDPRDVVCSEAHYLATMNRWHRMHGRFSVIKEAKNRVALSIDGIGNESVSPCYPDINLRYRRYLPWITDATTCAVRFEDLAGLAQHEEVRRIMDFYLSSARTPMGQLDDMVTVGLSHINPTRSHTFRKGGGIRSWERYFDERLKNRFKEVAGSLLIELGYETDYDW